jgi:hypothetical protein
MYVDSTIEANITSELTTMTILRSLLNRAWFSPAEIALWVTALNKTMNSYQHVGHCIFSVYYLQHDLQTDPKEGVGKLAYQHQVAGSECFRKDIVVGPRSFNDHYLVRQMLTGNSRRSTHTIGSRRPPSISSHWYSYS